MISLFTISSDVFIFPADAATINDTNVSTNVVDEKIYSQATLEDDFSGNGIITVLNREAAQTFSTYAPNDYLLIIAFRNPSYMSGEFKITTTQS